MHHIDPNCNLEDEIICMIRLHIAVMMLISSIPVVKIAAIVFMAVEVFMVVAVFDEEESIISINAYYEVVFFQIKLFSMLIALCMGHIYIYTIALCFINIDMAKIYCTLVILIYYALNTVLFFINEEIIFYIQITLHSNGLFEAAIWLLCYFFIIKHIKSEEIVIMKIYCYQFEPAR